MSTPPADNFDSIRVAAPIRQGAHLHGAALACRRDRPRGPDQPGAAAPRGRTSTPAAAETLVIAAGPFNDMSAHMEALVRDLGARVVHQPDVNALLAGPPPNGAACVVVDPEVCDGAFAPLLHRLRQAGWNLPVVLLGASEHVADAVLAARLGLCHAVPRNAGEAQSVAAVREALRRAEGRRSWDLRRQNMESGLASLTPREKEVMSAVVQGLTNRQIATNLGIHVKTVEAHRSRVMRKLGASSLAELVRFCVEAGLL